MNISAELVAALDKAVAVTWDTCHKIYVLMDDEALRQTLANGYGQEEDSIAYAGQDDLLDKVEEWYDEACELKMVDAISVVDGKEVFETLIEQFDEDDEDEDEE